MVVSIGNGIISALGLALTWIISVLPDTPFGAPSVPPDSINLGYVTWLLDFPTWLAHLSVLLLAIGVYYAYRIIARWIKLARD